MRCIDAGSLIGITAEPREIYFVTYVFFICLNEIVLSVPRRKNAAPFEMTALMGQGSD